MAWTPEELREILSADLHQENLAKVVSELQRMQAGDGLLTGDHEDAPLQGDVYEGVPCVVRKSGELKLVSRRAMLITNSCDADRGNARAIPVELTVVPVLRLSRYHQMLIDNSVTPEAADNMINAIKRQEKTNLLFLPSGGHLTEETVALLDAAQSMTWEQFREMGAPRRVAVLTQRGFWMLLIKLSMHFQRPHEGVPRAA